MPTRPPLVPASERVKRKRGRTGQRQRKRRLQRSKGLCERCLERGITSVADVVNHKTALAHGGNDEDWNTENLCRPCDLEITAEQFGFATIDGSRGVDPDGRPTFINHPWNLNRGVGGVESRGPGGRTPLRTHRLHCDEFESEKLEVKRDGGENREGGSGA